MAVFDIDSGDRAEIEALISRYSHGIDTGRADLCTALFTEDARLDTPVGNARGTEEIRAWFDGRLAMREEGVQVFHYVVNTLLAPVTEDRVRSRSMLLYTRQEIDVPLSAQLLATGIYEDELVHRIRLALCQP